MANVFDFNGCRIMVRDSSTGDILADTRIVSYDRKRQVVSIDNLSLPCDENKKLVIFIFTQSEMVEYMGTVRKSPIASGVDIALYKINKRDERNYRRYPLIAIGVIEKVHRDNEWVLLPNFMEASLKNMSATGVLVTVNRMTYPLKLGSIFLMTSIIGKIQTNMECLIVRERPVSDLAVEFGCKFLKVYKE